MLGINPKKIVSIVNGYTNEFVKKMDKIIKLLEDIKKILEKK